MLGPYDYPTFIDEQFGWKAGKCRQRMPALRCNRTGSPSQDWPTNYFRRVQNVDSGQPQHQWNRLRTLALASPERSYEF